MERLEALMTIIARIVVEKLSCAGMSMRIASMVKKRIMNKPKVTYVNDKWRCTFKGLWYCGDTPVESYDHCKKFHYPKEF
jgi:hypothetical protein